MADLIPVQTKELDFAALVRKVEDLNKKDIVYEFSNSRQFEDSGSNGGIYNQS